MKSKIVKGIFVFILAAVVLYFLYSGFLPDTEVLRVLEESNSKLLEKERKIRALKCEIIQQEKAISILQEEKKTLAGEIDSVSKQIASRSPYQVETLTFNDKEWVPKKDYQSLFQLTLILKSKTERYINLDLKVETQTDELLSKYKNIDTIRVDQVDGLVKDRNKIARLKRKRFSLVFGPGIHYRPGGNITFGISLTFGFVLL